MTYSKAGIVSVSPTNGTITTAVGATTAMTMHSTYPNKYVVRDNDRVYITFDGKDYEAYEDWLFRAVVSFGIGNAIPVDTYISMPVSKRIAADGAGHVELNGTEFMLTLKAKRYLEAVEIMKARASDGRTERRD